MQAMGAPFFSVIVPTYNRLYELQNCLQTVFLQTEHDFEILVIDDHSTDNTLEWLKTINDSRLKILSNTNTKGGCGARNTGIEAAKGEWIAFLDSDDWWHIEKLSVVKAAIEQEQDYHVFYSSCFYVDAAGYENPMPTRGLSGNILQQLGRMNPVRGFSSLVVKKQALLTAGKFDEQLPARQDIDLYFRLAQNEHFFYIDRRLAFISFFSTNKISFNSKNRFQGWMKVYKKYKHLMSYSDRWYQQKRIAFFAYKAGAYYSFFRYLPGALVSIVVSRGVPVQE